QSGIPIGVVVGCVDAACFAGDHCSGDAALTSGQYGAHARRHCVSKAFKACVPTLGKRFACAWRNEPGLAERKPDRADAFVESPTAEIVIAGCGGRGWRYQAGAK